MTRIYLIYFLFALSFILIPIVAIQGAHQLGVPPSSEWDCPVTHPVKGNFTTYSGESCIAHLPGASTTIGRSPNAASLRWTRPYERAAVLLAGKRSRDALDDPETP